MPASSYTHTIRLTAAACGLFRRTEQKHVVKVTAMQTLTNVLQAASSKFKPALQLEQCELQLSKKAVDLRTPFRLLNVPAGSKLEIIKSKLKCICSVTDYGSITAGS